MKTYSTEHWHIRLPDDWVAEVDEEIGCVALYHPNGYGSLDISTTPQAAAITREDLLAIAADHLDSGAKPAEARIGDFDGIEIEYDDGELYWREWHVKHGRVMLFITYHCGLGDEEKEDALVDVMLATLKATPSAP